MSAYPTPWQKRTMWAALTALFVVLLIVIAGAVVYVGANLISFLQPILIPIAVAVILFSFFYSLPFQLFRRHKGRRTGIAVVFSPGPLSLIRLVWGGLAAPL